MDSSQKTLANPFLAAGFQYMPHALTTPHHAYKVHGLLAEIAQDGHILLEVPGEQNGHG